MSGAQLNVGIGRSVTIETTLWIWNTNNSCYHPWTGTRLRCRVGVCIGCLCVFKGKKRKHEHEDCWRSRRCEWIGMSGNIPEPLQNSHTNSHTIDLFIKVLSFSCFSSQSALSKRHLQITGLEEIGQFFFPTFFFGHKITALVQHIQPIHDSHVP